MLVFKRFGAKFLGLLLLLAITFSCEPSISTVNESLQAAGFQSISEIEANCSGFSYANESPHFNQYCQYKGPGGLLFNYSYSETDFIRVNNTSEVPYIGTFTGELISGDGFHGTLYFYEGDGEPRYHLYGNEDSRVVVYEVSRRIQYEPNENQWPVHSMEVVSVKFGGVDWKKASLTGCAGEVFIK